MSSERIYPYEMNPACDLVLGHRFRYILARGFLHPGDTVLDAACGSGYGSETLSQVAKSVIGLDYDPSPVDYANKRFGNDNGRFVLQDLDTWVPEPDSFDVAVSFETIEHLVQEPKVFADKLKSAATRLIIVSAPIVPTVGINHYHKHDLTDDQMVNLFQDETWMLFEKVKQRVYGIYVFAKRDRIAAVR